MRRRGRGRRTRPPFFQRPVWRIGDYDFAARQLLRLRRPRMIVGDSVKIPNANRDQASAYEKVLHVHAFGSKGQAMLRLTLLRKSGLPAGLWDGSLLFMVGGKSPSVSCSCGTQAIDRLLEKTPRNRRHEQRADSEQHQA